MCLTVRLQPVGLEDADVRRLATDAPTSMGFGYEGRGILRRHPARLALHGCDLLTDEADWNAATWDMTWDAAAGLADSIDYFIRKAPQGLIAEAFWDGDRAESTVELSADAFLDLVRSGRLGTKTRYAVTPSRDIAQR
jgi:hypothetical protein